MFITIEGLDGSGKTFHAGRIAEWLKDIGENVLLLTDLGGTDIGRQILDNLVIPEKQKIRPESELLLKSAVQAQMVYEVIRPHLEMGGIVVRECYIDSAYAQGFGQGIDLEVLNQIMQFSTGGLYPDITVLLDVLPEKLAIQNNGMLGTPSLKIQEYARIRTGYLSIVKKDPKRWVVINSNEEPERIQNILKGIISNKLRERNREHPDFNKKSRYGHSADRN